MVDGSVLTQIDPEIDPSYMPDLTAPPSLCNVVEQKSIASTELVNAERYRAVAHQSLVSASKSLVIVGTKSKGISDTEVYVGIINICKEFYHVLLYRVRQF